MKEGIKFEGQITGKICLCLKSLIKTIGGENPVYQRNAYTCLQQIISQDSSRTSALSSVSCTRLWRRQGTEAKITRTLWLPYPIPVHMVKAREEKMVLIAQRYANAIMGLSRNSLDRALVSHCLCERCPIPAILYDVRVAIIPGPWCSKVYPKATPMSSTNIQCY